MLRVYIGVFVAFFLNSGQIEYKVTKVVDGDTVHVEAPGQEKLKIRLFGVDSPEKTQPFGINATALIKKNFLNQKVKIEVIDKDRYGRIVAKVKLENGLDLGSLLLKEGLGWYYQKYAPNEKEYYLLEQEARQKKRGLWSQKSPEAPWDYRANKRKRAEKKKKKKEKK